MGRIIIAVLFVSGSCWAQPTISSGGVISAGAFGALPAVAPGSWIEIYGSGLASTTSTWTLGDFNGTQAPSSLAGTSVMIGGQPAFVDYVSPGQVNVQVPSNVGIGQQSIIVTNGTVQGSPAPVPVDTVVPGLLAPPQFNINGKQYAVALFTDGKTYVLPPSTVSGVIARRAQPGDAITFYGVGFGSVIPPIPAGQIVQQQNALAMPIQVFFGDTEALVGYAGLAPGEVGLYQVNVTVPSVASTDAAPVTFTLGGAPGLQTLFTTVQNGSLPPPPPFMNVTCLCAFQPTQGASSLESISILPNGGVFTAQIGLLLLVNGTSSTQNQTFTFSTPFGSTPRFISGTTELNVTSATLSFTLTPSNLGLSGTLSVTGTPYPGGGAPMTLSGPISGSYTEQ